MKITVYFSDFCDAFLSANRNNNFTYAGKRALFEYLEEYEESTGEEIELDAIALCCEYSEMTTDEVIDCYSLDDDGLDDEEKDEAVKEYLENNTSVVMSENGRFLFAEF